LATRSAGKFKAERTSPPLQAKTANQRIYLDALRTAEQIVVMGPAGTGKTFIAGTHAADGLREHRFTKVIITRPNVPGGRSLGYFKGDMQEKIAPWVAELFRVMTERMGQGTFDCALSKGNIEVVPFEVMRGRSWDNALIILDEAQNTTAGEMKMFLTRIGENSQVVINGDVNQSDLKENSGLRTIIHMIKSRMLPVPVVEFGLDDIVRSGACAMWVRAFAAEQL